VVLRTTDDLGRVVVLDAGLEQVASPVVVVLGIGVGVGGLVDEDAQFAVL
jgi:hypothetical protein